MHAAAKGGCWQVLSKCPSRSVAPNRVAQQASAATDVTISARASAACAGFLSVPMTIATQSFVALVNHLLIREAWARERLIPYAGKTARLVLPPVMLEFEVQGGGTIAVPQSSSPLVHREPRNSDLPPQRRDDTRRAACGEARALEAADHGRPADVTITVPLSALPAFASGGQATVMKHVRMDGDAEFAATIAKLAEHLRWDAEEDLARLIGDAPAHRIASAARGVAGYARRAGLGWVGALAEYLLDEDPQLVRRTHGEQFTDELARTRDMLARIEKRIERAERAIPVRVSRGGSLPDSLRTRSGDDLH